MSECPKCGGERMEKGLQRTTRTLLGRTYSAAVPGSRCLDCGETYFNAVALLRFELAIAAHIARHGPVSGESLSWMRRALGLSGEKLASMLDVRPETLSRWERGRRDVDRNAWLVASALVLEEIEGRGSTRDRIAAVTRGRQPKRVNLDLSEIPSGLPPFLATV